jgi:hypothetical protein
MYAPVSGCQPIRVLVLSVNMSDHVNRFEIGAANNGTLQNDQEPAALECEFGQWEHSRSGSLAEPRFR